MSEQFTFVEKRDTPAGIAVNAAVAIGTLLLVPAAFMTAVGIGLPGSLAESFVLGACAAIIALCCVFGVLAIDGLKRRV